MSITNLPTYNYSALIILGGMCVLIKQTYPLVDYYLQNFEKYKTLPLERRKYIIKNFIKSFLILIVSSVLFRPLIIPALYRNQWNNQLVHTAGAIYASNDIMGLVMVKNLHYSTKMHHGITTILCLMAFGLDFQVSHLGKLIFVYTVASAHAYLVNFYLGARLITDKANLEIVRITARNIYFICCFTNWSWHLLWVLTNYGIIHMGHMVYFILLFWIIKDDIILLSWLNNTMIRF